MQSPSGSVRSPSGSVRGLVQQFENNTRFSPTPPSRNGFKLQSYETEKEVPKFGKKDKSFNLRGINDDKTTEKNLQERQNDFRLVKDIITKEEIHDKPQHSQEHIELLSSNVTNWQKCPRKNSKDKGDFQPDLPMSDIQSQWSESEERFSKIILEKEIITECEKNITFKGEISSSRSITCKMFNRRFHKLYISGSIYERCLCLTNVI